jgi:hypothetical protein
MWNIDLTQNKQYYEKQVMARGCHTQERGRVKEVKKVNIFDVLPTQE